MKKGFKLLSAALIALASFVPAQATSLLVNDGTATNRYSPIDGYDFDVTDLRVQTIYPEAQVAEMAGTFIKSMKFYIADEGGCVFDGVQLGVYLGTTTQTGFGNYGASPIEGLTHVGNVTLNNGDTEVLVEFDTPFAYDGGNLIVETTKPGEGLSSQNMYFYGVDNNTNYNVIVKRAWSNYTDSFYPKTTFEYEALENLAILSTRDMAFGNLYPEQTASQTFTLKNAGQNAFTPVFGALQAPFSITPAAAAIAPGETVEYTVAFAPAALGEFAQNLTIDCGAAGQFEVAISGACVEVPAEIVVCDGTSSNASVPVYGYYYDEASQAQMIYPAAELTALAGKKIDRVTFHPTHPTTTLTYNGGKLQLSFKAVEEDGFTGYDKLTDFTVVATLEPTNGDTELTFVLDEPYEYVGGNLAIECLLLEAGSNYPAIYYKGKDMENYPSLYYYGRSNSSGVSHFLPKITFGYVKDDAPVVITSYTVVGPETIFGTNWNTDDTNNDMTFDAENGVYTWSKEDVTLYNGFEFKVVGNHDYTVYEWPVGPYNWVANLPEDGGEGVYDILITFDPDAADADKITCTLTKVGDVDPIEHVYTVVGPEAVFGTEWNVNDENNNMTLDAETGLYTWSKENVALTETFGFKVVGDHSWANEWPQGYDNNWIVYIDEAGNYNLFITFDPATGEINCTATKVEEPVGLRGDVNNDGTINIADVTALINHVLMSDYTDADNFSSANADCNKDGKWNIADVTALINYILSKQWPN